MYVTKNKGQHMDSQRVLHSPKQPRNHDKSEVEKPINRLSLAR